MTTDTNATTPAGDTRPHPGAPVDAPSTRRPAWPAVTPRLMRRLDVRGRPPVRPTDDTPPTGTPAYPAPVHGPVPHGLASPDRGGAFVDDAARRGNPAAYGATSRHVSPPGAPGNPPRTPLGGRPMPAPGRPDSTGRHALPPTRPMPEPWPPAHAARGPAGPPAPAGARPDLYRGSSRPVPPARPDLYGGPYRPGPPPAMPRPDHRVAVPGTPHRDQRVVVIPIEPRPDHRVGAVDPRPNYRVAVPVDPRLDHHVAVPVDPRLDHHVAVPVDPRLDHRVAVPVAPRAVAVPRAVGAATRVGPAPAPTTYAAGTYRQRMSRALTDSGETTGLSHIRRAMRDDDVRHPPAPKRLVVACAWALMVGVVGLVLAVWSAIEVLVGAPSWFLPAAGAIGLVGFASTLIALSASRKPFAPWLLLGLATCALGASVYLIEISDTIRAIATR